MGIYDNQSLYSSLKELSVIESSKLDSAYKESVTQKIDFYDELIDRDLISDENLGKVIADLFKVPYVNLSKEHIEENILKIIPEVIARKQRIICFGLGKDGIKVAADYPINREIIGFISKKTGEKVNVYFATKKDINEAFSLYRKNLQASFDELLTKQILAASESKASELPIARLSDLLIEYAYSNRASDIHIEPEKKASVVRFRIDGVLHEVLRFPKNIHDQLVTKIKVSSKLRTDEHLAAQDGKMQLTLPNEDLDIRVSIVPIVNGEKVVMRLLSSRSRQYSLEDLGMRESDLLKVKDGFNKPYGMFLSTGPTGCGKTTTIYTILKILNVRSVNIASIEDPVEYDIEGVNQIQVNSKTNLTFANGLRAILRQDPNVIFVGEIRDSETADIAVNSALTGHLVLSTLHTNDAATTLPRLIDMGVEPFLVASTVNVIVGQRLVRKICEKCRKSQSITATELKKFFPADLLKKHTKNREARIYAGKGCSVCNMTGYNGRIGIFEVLSVTQAIRDLITSKADSDKLRDCAIKEGMSTLIEDGLVKVLEGQTTIDEIIRVTKE